MVKRLGTNIILNLVESFEKHICNSNCDIEVYEIPSYRNLTKVCKFYLNLNECPNQKR